MKKIVILALVAVAFTACKKEPVNTALELLNGNKPESELQVQVQYQSEDGTKFSNTIVLKK